MADELSCCGCLEKVEMRRSISFGFCLLFAASLGLNAQEAGSSQPNADPAQTSATPNPSVSANIDQTPAAQTPHRPAGVPNPGLILGFELSPIFSFHLGPVQKVKVWGNDASN